MNHKFNDDLLLWDADRELVAARYPSIVHVLDHRELRQLFVEYDEPANRAKRKGMTAGFWAIGLGFSALAIAAAEIILFIRSTGDPAAAEVWAKALAAVSFLCGIV